MVRVLWLIHGTEAAVGQPCLRCSPWTAADAGSPQGRTSVPTANVTGLITTAAAVQVAGTSSMGWSDGTIMVHAAVPPTPEAESWQAQISPGMTLMMGSRMAHTGPEFVAAIACSISMATVARMVCVCLLPIERGEEA